MCVCACVCGCTPAGAGAQTEPPSSPRLQAQVSDTRKGSCGQRPARPHREHSRRLSDAPRGPLGRRLPLPQPRCCRSLHKRLCCHGGHHRQFPPPTLPWQSSTSADVQSRPRHRKVTEKSMWRRGTAPSGIHEVSNGIGTGKETQIPSIQDTGCSHNFGPKKSLLGHLCRST